VDPIAPRLRHQDVPRKSKVDWQAVREAAPHGVARTAELRDLGVAPGTIAGRTRSGQWERGSRGQIRLRTGPATPEERLDSALRLAGPGAVLSGAAACRLYGLTKLPGAGTILVLVPHGRRRQDADEIHLERTHRPPPAVVRGGFPCAPLERAVLDAARHMVRLDPVRSLLAEAVQRRFTTVPRLAEELAVGTRRGSRFARIALAELEVGVRSTAEAWAREIAVEMEHEGFPRVEWNRAIHLASTGAFLFSPDGWIDEVGAAWEIESVEYHLDPEDQERSYARRAVMNTHDVVLVEHRPKLLRTKPSQVKREVREAYERALRRPRPPLEARAPR
jgi:hypothetical protein